MGTRNPFAASEVVSRRGGAVKEPLSRDRIVAGALDLLGREGLAGMSLRKVAQALETGPASLYAYVDDLEELQALVLDKALGEVKTKAPRGPAVRSRLEAVLASHLSVLLSRPGLAQLAMTTIAVGPNGLRIVEALLGVLAEGGVDPATAAWAVDLLTLYTTAIAVEQSHRQAQERAGGEDTLAPVARAVAAVSSDSHPHIAAAREHLVSGTGRDRGAWAIDVLLNGILHTPRAAGKASAVPSSRRAGRPPAARSRE
jgi:AcrR family transcriptional regulator